MFIDKPIPGTGYVFFMALLMAACIFMPFILRHFFRFRLPLHIALIVSLWGAASIFGIIIHALYNTHYTLTERTLHLECGTLIEEEIPLADIRNVQTVAYIPQSLGWTLKWKGFCNRFYNGVRFNVSNRTIFISPTDPEEFMKLLMERIEGLEKSS